MLISFFPFFLKGREVGVAVGQRGLALCDVTSAIWTIWHGRCWRTAAQFAGGSCSICLLMSTVVGGTHVCHVTRLAGSTFTWRSGHRGKWQMFSPSWWESQGSPEQSEGPDKSPTTTATTCVDPAPKTKSQLFAFIKIHQCDNVNRQYRRKYLNI